jgi:toxin ParE1/3/4
VGTGTLQVVWTEGAVRDLNVVAAFLAEAAPAVASRLVVQILEAAGSLGTLGSRGRIVHERDEDRVRELLVSSYRLIYYLGSEQVSILGLLHQRQDFESWLLRTGRDAL